MSSFLLRALNVDDEPSQQAIPPPSFVAGPFMQTLQTVQAHPTFSACKNWSIYLGLRAARYSWVLGTSMLILLFPLWLEVEREDAFNAFEQQQVAMYTARGYSAMTIEQMKMRGELGVMPVPPPQQPGFP